MFPAAFFVAMVAVFSTDVSGADNAQLLQKMLSGFYPSARITFDLEDIDRVLRIEGESINNSKVIATLNCIGYKCNMLE